MTDQTNAPETVELRRLASRFMVVIEAFLEHNAVTFRELGFPLEACRRLFADLVNEWIDQPTATPPQMSATSIERFPEEVRAFFRPDQERR